MNEDDILFGKPRRDLDEPKELKIKLPLRYHVRLHSLKLLRKQNIAASVMHALDDYFARSAPVRLGEVPTTATATTTNAATNATGHAPADESHATG